ncbi:MAG: PfkB family carbohydrate kinase [Proteobacteria bacterium]|nr:PfkB family carbohydrate kinase [Pseudomonadota bacterium]
MSAPDLHVVGIGSMVVDRMHRTRRMPEVNEKATLETVDGASPVRQYTGGVVLNHLGWAAVLGLRTGIFGKQADDAGGRFLRGAMDRLGIERHLVLDGSATSMAEIFVDDAGARTIYMARGATAETDAAHVRREHADFIRRGAKLSTEVSQLPLAAALEALGIAREAGRETIVDLDIPPSEALAHLGDEQSLERVLASADLLKPAKGAAREFASGSDPDALSLAQTMRRRFGNRAVVVTDGDAGCAICAEGFEGVVPARSVRVVDTTGAGDAFLGGLLAGLEHGLDWEDAAQLANACGAACASQLGAFPEDPAAARESVLRVYEGPPLDLPPMQTSRAPAPEDAAVSLLEIAAEELAALASRASASDFAAAAELIEASRQKGGRVHVTGVGKPEHVARYGAASLASTGTPASFLHATETLHGGVGQVEPGDVVVAISNSGTTRELCRAVDALRGRGARVVAVTGRLDSALARAADAVLDAGVAREGGPLGLAPRASVAAELLVVAALGALLQTRSGFSAADYAARHPAGALGEAARTAQKSQSAD